MYSKLWWASAACMTMLLSACGGGGGGDGSGGGENSGSDAGNTGSSSSVETFTSTGGRTSASAKAVIDMNGAKIDDFVYRPDTNTVLMTVYEEASDTTRLWSGNIENGSVELISGGSRGTGPVLYEHYNVAYASNLDVIFLGHFRTCSDCSSTPAKGLVAVDPQTGDRVAVEDETGSDLGRVTFGDAYFDYQPRSSQDYGWLRTPRLFFIRADSNPIVAERSGSSPTIGKARTRTFGPSGTLFADNVTGLRVFGINGSEIKEISREPYTTGYGSSETAHEGIGSGPEFHDSTLSGTGALEWDQGRDLLLFAGGRQLSNIVSVDRSTGNRTTAYFSCGDSPDRPVFRGIEEIEVIPGTSDVLIRTAYSNDDKVFRVTLDHDGAIGGDLTGGWFNQNVGDPDSDKNRQFNEDGSGAVHLGTYHGEDLAAWNMDWRRTGEGVFESTKRDVVACNTGGQWEAIEGGTTEQSYRVVCEADYEGNLSRLMILTGVNSTRVFREDDNSGLTAPDAGEACDPID